MATLVGLDKKRGHALIAQLVTESLISRSESAMSVNINRSMFTYPDMEKTLVPSTEDRVHERAWIEAHSRELSQFAGEWIIVEGEQLIAHGFDLVEVVRKAKSLGVNIPYVAKIPKGNERPFVGYQWKKKFV